MNKDINITYNYQRLNRKIEAVYNAVIEFIEYYNILMKRDASDRT